MLKWTSPDTEHNAYCLAVVSDSTVDVAMMMIVRQVAVGLARLGTAGDGGDVRSPLFGVTACCLVAVGTGAVAVVTARSVRSAPVRGRESLALCSRHQLMPA